MKNETTNYYQADVAQKGYTEYTDNDGIVYRSNEKGNYTGSDGKTYKLENNTFTEIDSDGNAVSNGRTATVTEDQKKEVKTTYSHGNTALSDTTRAADLLSRFRENHKDTLTDEVISKLTSNIEKVNVYESAEDSLDDTDTYSKKNIISSIQQAYQSGGASAVTEVTNKYAEKITENQTAMTTAQKKMDDNSVLADLAAMDSTSAEYTTALADFVKKVQDSQSILNQSSTLTNSGAKKIAKH